MMFYKIFILFKEVIFMKMIFKNKLTHFLVFSFTCALFVQDVQAVRINGEAVDFGENNSILVSFKVDPQYKNIIFDIEDDNITTSIIDDISLIDETTSDYEELNSHKESFSKLISSEGRVTERAGGPETKGSIVHQGCYVYAFDEFILNSNNKIVFESTIAEVGKGIHATAPKFLIESFFVSTPNVHFLAHENTQSWFSGVSCFATPDTNDRPYSICFDGAIDFKNPSKSNNEFTVIGADSVSLHLRKM